MAIIGRLTVGIYIDKSHMAQDIHTVHTFIYFTSPGGFSCSIMLPVSESVRPVSDDELFMSRSNKSDRSRSRRRQLLAINTEVKSQYKKYLSDSKHIIIE